MRIIDLTLKNVTQIVRDWKAAFFMLVVPVIFTLLMGFIFGGFGGGEQDPRLPVGFVDQDESAVSAHLLTLLEGSDAIRPVTLEDADEAEEQVREEELAAAVIVPAGYGDRIFDDDSLHPTVIVDDSTLAGTAAQSAIHTAMMRLLGGVQTAKLSAAALGNADGAFLMATLDKTLEAWQDPPLTVTVAQSGIIVNEEETPAMPGGFAHSSVANLVQFSLMGIIGAAGLIVNERKSRTLLRMLTTTISRAEIILAYFLTILILNLVQLALMIAFGAGLLGVDYLREPVAVLLMMVTTALCTAGMGLLIGVLSKTDDQVAMFSVIPTLLMAGLGGAWMPLEFTSQAFQFVGHLTPVAWAIEGFENLVVRGMELNAVLLPATVLAAFGAVLFSLAVWRFKFE
ncbi:MAG: ABC transporter permease [Anaerolineae bacterium]|nr:ABC transporter permease [Anaerolineae bacterium]